ncbi:MULTISPECIES: RNA polymerase sigma factor [Hyphobacterium]|uniref:RNA polymerase sigma factor n=1 Tax=Hyphobacterium vulgare TaxID=1736751 RepID=A0ABV7A0K3_9PROT
MTSGRPDAVLVAAARRGSDAAFTALVVRHQQGLRGFLRRLCRDPDVADDLAQDAFLAAWTSLASLKDPARFRSWLYGLAWRQAASRFRTDDRRRAREWAYTAETADLPGLSPEDRIALDRAMSDLPPDQRAAIALCLSGGFSHSEAAEALGIPVGTVKSHVTRGRAKLLEALGGQP